MVREEGRKGRREDGRKGTREGGRERERAFITFSFSDKSMITTQLTQDLTQRGETHFLSPSLLDPEQKPKDTLSALLLTSSGKNVHL